MKNEPIEQLLSADLLANICQVVDAARSQIQQTVNVAMVQAYWQIGRLIVEQEQQGNSRAEYGQAQLKQLSKQLTQEYGKGFSARNLANMRRFYLAFENLQTLSAKLSWSHYTQLIRVEKESARLWYMQEAAEQNWSVRALERQIGTLYYERLLASQNKAISGYATRLFARPLYFGFLEFREWSLSGSGLRTSDY